MPPKKPINSKPGASNKTVGNKSKGAAPVIKSKEKGKSSSSSKTKSPPKKKVPSKEQLAAIKIQKCVRGYLAKVHLKRLKDEKQKYEEMIEKIQRQAWLDVVQREREEHEKQRQKEEEERKRKRQIAEWKSNLIEAAFDGELDTIKNILKEAEDMTRKSCNLCGESLERTIQRFKRELIESTDANQNSAFSESCAGGALECVQFFVENHVDVNLVGQFNRTGLFRASFAGHLSVVKFLLKNGADPRILDSDGMTPDKVSAVEEVCDLVSAWDVSITDRLLEELQRSRDQRSQAEQQIRIAQQQIMEEKLSVLEEEYSTKQRVLQKAHEELNKRIYEHDKCADRGSSKVNVTLQSVNNAEEDLVRAQLAEKECRERLAQLRLQMREESHNTEEDSRCAKCNIKELDDVLMRDVGNLISNNGRYPLLIDTSTQAVTFLRYRDTNYLNALDPKDMQPNNLRLALLGALRYGKCFVVDMMEVNMMQFLEERLDQLQPGLYKDILSKNIIQTFATLIRPEDSAEYTRDKFLPSRLNKFSFVVVTKMDPPPSTWLDDFYGIRVITPSMS